MAELFLHISVSLEGYIQDRDHKLEWVRTDDEFQDHILEILAAIDAMIFGKIAHAQLAEFWPDAAKRQESSPAIVKEAKFMNALPKYVLTHDPLQAKWANSHAVSIDDIRRIKKESSRPIAVFAGAGTAQALLAEGLLDELRLLRHPVLLGGGTPLFSQNGELVDLSLVEQRRFESGAILENYRPVPAS